MLTIQTGENNPILRKTIAPVTVFGESLSKLLEAMTATMLQPDPETKITGIGLAANQINVDARILLITLNVNTKKEHKIVPMINPEILECTKETVSMEEGCLSLPGQFAKIVRPSKVKITWQNEKGNWCKKLLTKWDARIFQHEYDHLEGKLFTDYLTEEQRIRLRNKAEKN